MMSSCQGENQGEASRGCKVLAHCLRRSRCRVPTTVFHKIKAISNVNRLRRSDTISCINREWLSDFSLWLASMTLHRFSLKIPFNERQTLLAIPSLFPWAVFTAIFRFWAVQGGIETQTETRVTIGEKQYKQRRTFSSVFQELWTLHVCDLKLAVLQQWWRFCLRRLPRRWSEASPWPSLLEVKNKKKTTWLVQKKNSTCKLKRGARNKNLRTPC